MSGATRTQVVTPDGSRLAAWVAGAEGSPGLVLVAGGGADHCGWRTIVPELAASEEERRLWAPHGRSLAAQCRVVVYDQRGTGESVAVEPARSAQALGADAIAVGKALIGESFALVGESMGGMAVLHAVLDHPEVVTALGLLATTAGGAGMTWPSEAFLAHATSGADPADESTIRSGMELAVSRRFRSEHPALFEAWVRHAQTQPVSPLIGEAQVQIFLTHDVAGRLDEIRVPTTVICGTEDQAHPLANSEYLAAHIPGARLVVIQGAGHLVDAEAPEPVLDELSTLLLRRG